MTKPDLVPANLPTLPTAQMLARLSAEPGRCEMTVDSASPWVAGVIVRTPRLYLALHAVNAGEAQIIASPRVSGLQGSGDAQLQALLANAAPKDDSAYRAVPPPAVEEAAPPPLNLPATQDLQPARSPVDLPLVVTWSLFAALAIMGGNVWLLWLVAVLLIGAVISAMLGVPRGNATNGGASALRTVSLISGVFGLLSLLFASSSVVAPIVVLLALVSVGSGVASRLGGISREIPAVLQHETPPAESGTPQALPAPQVQLIEITRAQLTEHLVEAERSGNPRDVFEARQALEVHLPEVVERWEALPSWRRRDEAPLRRTLEKLTTASLPDTTTSELEWDATERFIEQKARAKATETSELSTGREP